MWAMIISNASGEWGILGHFYEGDKNMDISGSKRSGRV